MKNFGGLFCVRFIPSSDGSELYLCPTTCGLSDKGARPAGALRRSQVAPLLIDDIEKDDEIRRLLLGSETACLHRVGLLALKYSDFVCFRLEQVDRFQRQIPFSPVSFQVQQMTELQKLL